MVNQKLSAPLGIFILEYIEAMGAMRYDFRNPSTFEKSKFFFAIVSKRYSLPVLRARSPQHVSSLPKGAKVEIDAIAVKANP
jgi:hypothetical protein